ncbi:MAG TPA: thioredoxin TrxC [Duganella sp.]|jgi:thioredoxin 2
MTNSSTAQPESLHIVCPHCDAVNRVPVAKLSADPVCGKCQRALFTGQPVDLPSARFLKQIARSDIPVLVDFWAPWCGPCRTMAPFYAQATQRLEPHYRVVKVNTEEAQDLSARYSIRSIPTLALFKGGREIARQPGAMDASNIVAWATQNNRG